MGLKATTCSPKCRRAKSTWGRETLAERFWKSVDKAGPVPAHAPHLGPCWVWTAARYRRGYGMLRGPNKTTLKAHRVSWEIANGTSPGRLQVLHRCDNPPCVRPDHLRLGTNGDNIRDAVRKGRRRPRGTAVGQHRWSK